MATNRHEKAQKEAIGGGATEGAEDAKGAGDFEDFVLFVAKGLGAGVE